MSRPNLGPSYIANQYSIEHLVGEGKHNFQTNQTTEEDESR
jgi:hypothetical protein